MKPDYRIFVLKQVPVECKLEAPSLSNAGHYATVRNILIESFVAYRKRRTGIKNAVVNSMGRFLVIVIFSLFGFGAVKAENLEYKIKAGFLYNFTKFVSWPEDNLETFNVCILGTDPFGNLLDPIEKRSVEGRPIKLIKLTHFEENKQCRILFIGQSSEHAYPREGYPIGVLTVGETGDFTETGGMIGFVLKNGKVRLRIDLSASRRGNLIISAKLLEVAEQVRSAND